MCIRAFSRSRLWMTNFKPFLILMLCVETSFFNSVAVGKWGESAPQWRLPLRGREWRGRKNASLAFFLRSLSFAEQSLSPSPSLRTQPHHTYQLHNFLILNTKKFLHNKQKKTHPHQTLLLPFGTSTFFHLFCFLYKTQKFKSPHKNPPFIHNLDFSKQSQPPHTKKTPQL